MSERISETTEPKIYVCYLGGRSMGCNIELHDIVFAVGRNLNEVIPQIKSKWFGQQQRLHLDMYLILDKINGFQIKISEKELNSDVYKIKKTEIEDKLWFVNFGGYNSQVFGSLVNFSSNNL